MDRLLIADLENGAGNWPGMRMNGMRCTIVTNYPTLPFSVVCRLH